MEINFGAINTLPPQNVEVEEQVLGGILLDPEAIARIADTLRPEAFYLSQHQQIYKAALALYGTGKLTDLMTVTTWLHDHSQLDRVGGMSKLAELVERTVTAVNVDRYAELLNDKYQRRRLIQAGNEISQLGHQTSVELEPLIDAAEQKVFDIKLQRSDRYVLETAQDMTVALYSHIEEGQSAGKRIGWYDLEELTGGFHNGTLTILGGATSMGKTQVMTAMSKEAMLALKCPVLFFSLEMSKHQLNTRMLSSLANIDSTVLMEGGSRIESSQWNTISVAIEKFSSLPWMVYDHPNPSIATIRSILKQAILQSGKPGVVFLDYIQMMNVEGWHGNRSLELGHISRELRAIAKDFDIPLVAGSQINRDVEKRSDKRSGKGDLRDSGEIAEVADAVIMLYRPAYYSKDTTDKFIEFNIDKNRVFGKTGTAKMLVDLEVSRFRNISGAFR